jgi:hypothetical protein
MLLVLFFLKKYRRFDLILNLALFVCFMQFDEVTWRLAMLTQSLLMLLRCGICGTLKSNWVRDRLHLRLLF